MKKIKVVSLALAIAFLFSGCSFQLASSVDELISPISLTGENKDIQNALNSFCSDGYSLVNPESGSYTNSYTFYDYDLDDVEEAIVFYEPSSSLGTVNMALIDKEDGSWSVVSNVEGDGADIYLIDFCDLTGDGDLEFVILWDVISDSTDHVLAVYKQSLEDGEFALEKADKTITVNNYLTVDIDLDDVSEIMVFNIENGDTISASATLYSFETGKLKSIGSTKLDGHINSYKNFSYETIDDTVYVYADAVKSSGTQMLTEIIYWSDYYDALISPYYSYSTGITQKMIRDVMLSTRDIDGDGKVEIPLDADVDDLPSAVVAVDWYIYKNSVLSHDIYSLAVEDDGYQVIIDDDWIDSFSVSYSDESSKMSVKDDSDNLIFSIVTVLETAYDESDYSDYEVIMENDGYFYLGKVGSKAEFKITTDELKSSIVSYEGD